MPDGCHNQQIERLFCQHKAFGNVPIIHFLPTIQTLSSSQSASVEAIQISQMDYSLAACQNGQQKQSYCLQSFLSPRVACIEFNKASMVLAKLTFGTHPRPFNFEISRLVPICGAKFAAISES